MNDSVFLCSYAYVLRKMGLSMRFINKEKKSCHWWTEQHVLFRSGCGRRLSGGARVGGASACRRCLPYPSPGALSGRSPASTPLLPSSHEFSGKTSYSSNTRGTGRYFWSSRVGSKSYCIDGRWTVVKFHDESSESLQGIKGISYHTIMIITMIMTVVAIILIIIIFTIVSITIITLVIRIIMIK